MLKITSSTGVNIRGSEIGVVTDKCLISGVSVRGGDGGQAGSAAFAGGGCGSRQSGAAQPAGGGEEVGALTSQVTCAGLMAV